jgi:hypothetical protein
MAAFFRYSCTLMDARSLERRPGYRQVMAEVNAMVPWRPRPRKAVGEIAAED